ncbi:ALG11 protein [Salpingoeca rosetta]|uniref:GDP-Man:Man(3)GlcNAc(2)-PP-Dol alpha-1,2-mannosyltransferase n=1 Tax=Salpingoeca rosetta (strain ATCC 50818 / BSB-021) TaxID=946362 RepID=F2U0T6_SALR5|nr:ALG11 protein [Salpingoeca rosetta]EGD80510.1 ALG11 protein [Salpingoeca rosetta]|eukprot:XP_004997071.1 ALG11 protein [Salpingoeca rosetta]
MPSVPGVPLLVVTVILGACLVVVPLVAAIPVLTVAAALFWLMGSATFSATLIALEVTAASALLVGAGTPPALRALLRFLRTRSPAHDACQRDIKHKTTATAQDKAKRSGRGAATRATKTLAFFHPYCNAGGGGERVLWSAINAVCEEYPHYHCIVYTGDTDASSEQILAKARLRFGVEVDQRRVTFVFLRTRPLVEAELYPRFTMLMQSLASMLMGVEALLAHVPDVFIDTMGYAFVLPLFAGLGMCPAAAYVHYPTISTDMLQKVAKREQDFNNTDSVSASATLSTVKLWYYRIFAFIYGMVGGAASAAMCNSTWTYNHIDALWWGAYNTASIVYPPCDVSQLTSLPLAGRQNVVVSVAQFRPEKNHALQLRALKAFIDTHGRGKEEEDFQIRTNVTYEELQEWLGRALIGLHTMKDEHFGIGVVEFMAAGAIALAHDSAGPQGDIVLPADGKPTGFLASTAEEYAEHMHTILNMTPQQRLEIQTRARESVTKRFSEEQFKQGFLRQMQFLLEG